MDFIAFFIIFLIFSLLMILPIVVIMHLREKMLKQQMEYRLNKISKQINISLDGNKIILKPDKHLRPKLTIGKIIFYTFIPIPPLIVLFLSSSFYSAFMSILIYFCSIFSMYYLFKKIRLRRYRKAFIQELPNSIDLIIRSLRAGRTITDSIKTVGEDTKGSVSVQFKNIVDQVELGKDFISVVNNISKKLDIPEFTFFVIVLSVQQETGGNIIKTLSSLANMLRQRQLMRLKIKALSSEGIFSAIFMGSLPILIAGIVALIRPEYIKLLFTNSTGNHMLIYGIVSEIIGCIVIARMVQIDV